MNLPHIELSKNNELMRFYDECEDVISNLVSEEHRTLIKDATKLNKILMRQPFETKDTEIKVNYDVLGIYNSLIKGEKNIDISQKPNKIKIVRSDMKVETWEKWMQEVIWYGHRSGAYLYKCETDLTAQTTNISSESPNNIGYSN